jgi:thiamine biosynthesis lipoprotein
MWRLVFLLLCPFTISAQLKRFRFSENKMGSPFNLIFYHNDSTEASAIAKESFAIVDSLNNIFSDYIPTSEVGRLTQLKPLQEQKISDELFSIILYSKQAWHTSDKTFDITIGALSQLWRKAKAENRFPTETEIEIAKQSTGFNNILIDPENKTIACKQLSLQLDFGGIVKGYAAQKVITYLKSKNVSIALADAGGDIAMSDAPPGKSGWDIGINAPEDELQILNRNLELKNCAVATSGDIYRYIIHDGKKYSHIIDPKTGYGVTSQRNVTVIFKDGAGADWLATACSILPIRKALRLAKKLEAELLIATVKDEKVRTHKTKGFDRYFEKKQDRTY